MTSRHSARACTTYHPVATHTHRRQIAAPNQQGPCRIVPAAERADGPDGGHADGQLLLLKGMARAAGGRGGEESGHRLFVNSGLPASRQEHRPVPRRCAASDSSGGASSGGASSASGSGSGNASVAAGIMRRSGSKRSSHGMQRWCGVSRTQKGHHCSYQGPRSCGCWSVVCCCWLLLLLVVVVVVVVVAVRRPQATTRLQPRLPLVFTPHLWTRFRASLPSPSAF